MITTKIYIACESPKLAQLSEAAQLIALQKGCDPVRVPWPQWLPSESGEEREKYDCELWVCQKQLRQAISNCDIFVAIVDGQYGKLRLQSPHEQSSVSAMHFEILEAIHTPERRPEIHIFTLSMEQDPNIQKMLSRVRSNITEFDADKQFKKIFSTKLAEYRQGILASHLAGLHRAKISVTCVDRRGLLARVTQVIEDHHGNIASGTQATKGPFAILHFIGEWKSETFPAAKKLEGVIQQALPEGAQVQIASIGPGEPEIQNLATFSITFVDQPGIAEHIFSRVNSQNSSILSASIETSLTGGLMIGKIKFTISGDDLSPEGLYILADELRKLPGVFLVDRTVLPGRYWR